MTELKTEGMTDFAAANTSMKRLIGIQVTKYLARLYPNADNSPIFFVSELKELYEALKLKAFPPNFEMQLGCMEGKRLAGLTDEELGLLRTVCIILLKGDL